MQIFSSPVVLRRPIVESSIRLAAAIALTLPPALMGVQALGTRAAPNPLYTAAAPRHQTAGSVAAMPVRLEPNVGQLPGEVAFVAHGTSYGLYFGRDGMTLTLQPGTKHAPAAVHMRMLGAAATVPVGVGRERSHSNYFIGANRARWHTNVPNYASLQYSGIYPGITMTFGGTQSSLEYSFLVAPRADSARIRLQFDRAEGLALDHSGNLVLRLPGGKLVQRAPILWQQDGRNRTAVAGSFRLLGHNTVGFRVGRYDHSRALTIDPTFDYASYFGGGSSDMANGVAYDGQGNIYIAGSTCTYKAGTFCSFTPVIPPFPVKSSGFGAAPGGNYDGFVAKFTPAGTGAGDQDYTDYVGGTGDDFVGASEVSNPTPGDLTNASGNGLAVDAQGNAYLTGSTKSSDFPHSANALQPARGGGTFDTDAFVTEVSTNGATLVYSSYLGGASIDFGTAIAVHGGAIYLTGYTISGPFPTTLLTPAGAFPITNGTTNASHASAFVTVLNPALAGSAQLVYSTFLSNGAVSTLSNGTGIAVDSAGNVYVTGDVHEFGGSGFPATANGYQPADPNPGPTHAFLVKLSLTNPTAPLSTQELYGSYFGGTGTGFANDFATGIAVDSMGKAALVLTTASTNLPTNGATYNTTNDTVSEAYVAQFNPALSGAASLTYSTYYGTPPGSSTFSNYQVTGNAIAVDPAGSIYITGYASGDITTTPGAVVPDRFTTTNTVQGPSQQGAYIAEFYPVPSLTAAQQLAYATYVSGGDPRRIFFDFGAAVAVDGNGTIYTDGVIATSSSLSTAANLLVPSPGAFQTMNNGGPGGYFGPQPQDAYFIKFLPASNPAPVCTIVGALARGSFHLGVAAGLRAPGQPSFPIGYVTYQNGISIFTVRNPTLTCIRPGLGTAVITLTGIVGSPVKGIFKAGDAVTVTITFSPGGAYTVEVRVTRVVNGVTTTIQDATFTSPFTPVSKLTVTPF